MSTNDHRKPYANTRMVKLLDKRLDELAKVGQQQRDIAFKIGFNRPNVLSMMKSGESKVPLDRVPAMAKALDVDVIHLFRLAFEQMGEEMEKAARTIFASLATENEREWLEVIRAASGSTDPELTPAAREALAELVSKNYAAHAA